MKTPLKPENPFGPHPKGYLWELLHARGDRPRHLDYGAHDGSMLKGLAESGVISEGVGVDLNADVVRASQGSLPKNVRLVPISKGARLDFPDESFDTVSIIGVIEHVHDQQHVLRELRRVLKKDGLLVVAVPGKHLFSFLDMGNFKFVFPRLHRWYYTWRHGAQKYRERYIECRNGLIGDVEVEKRWHQHFSHPELEDLLTRAGFKVHDRDGFGFFNRPIINLRYFMPGPLGRLMDRWTDWDARKFDRAEIFLGALKES